MSSDDVRGWEIVGKMNLAEKGSFEGKFENFEDNLLGKDIINWHTSKPERGLFIL